MNTDGAPPPSAPQKQVGPKFGRFSYDHGSKRMVWTERTYQIFGLSQSEVLPTPAVMSSHQHPDDRAAWDSAMSRALADGTTFCLWHRIVDGRRRVRSALTIVHPSGSTADGVTGISGFVVDVTDTLRRDREQETTKAVLDSAASRDLIEQAKGMLMVIFDLDDAQSFDLLRWHSSHNNIKVREVAATLVDRLIDPALAGMLPRQRLTAILEGLDRRTVSAVSAPDSTPPAGSMLMQAPEEVDTTPSPSSNRRISSADLPRTMMRAVKVASQSISIADWLDPEQPLVYVNDAFETLTGYSADEILGRNCRFLQGADADPKVVADMRFALDHGREVRAVLRNHRKDGTGFWNEVHLSSVRDETGRITHYIGYQVDVSERVEREQTLRRLAYHDARTGLPNEAAALADLDAAVRSSAEQGTSFTVLYVAFSEDATGGGLCTLPTSTMERIRHSMPRNSAISVLNNDALLIRLAAVRATTDRAESVADIWSALTDAVANGRRGPIRVRIGTAEHPKDGAEPAALIEKARIDAIG